MLLKDAYELEMGMILAQDVLNQSDTVVLTSGTELTDVMILNLQNMNIDFIFVEDLIDEPEIVSSIVKEPKIKARVQELYRREKFDMAVQFYKEMYLSVRKGQLISHSAVFDVVKELVKEFYQYDDIFSVLKKLKSNEDYEFTHSTSTCIISILLGKWLKLEHQKLYTLAEAAYLADIGKSRLPMDLLTKSGKLSEDEHVQLKNHVALTQEILEYSGGFAGDVIHIAATHHERLNGSGYPYRMEKDGITQLSRIVAVADTYHALLSQRPYRDAYSICEATEMLWNMSYNELDPAVTERLVKFITSFWVGGKVILSNGATGEVIMANQYDRFRPLVKVEDNFIDLSQDRSYKIVGIVNTVM